MSRSYVLPAVSALARSHWPLEAALRRSASAGHAWSGSPPPRASRLGAPLAQLAARARTASRGAVTSSGPSRLCCPHCMRAVLVGHTFHSAHCFAAYDHLVRWTAGSFAFSSALASRSRRHHGRCAVTAVCPSLQWSRLQLGSLHGIAAHGTAARARSARVELAPLACSSTPPIPRFVLRIAICVMRVTVCDVDRHPAPHAGAAQSMCMCMYTCTGQVQVQVTSKHYFARATHRAPERDRLDRARDESGRDGHTRARQESTARAHTSHLVSTHTLFLSYIRAPSRRGSRLPDCRRRAVCGVLRTRGGRGGARRRACALCAPLARTQVV